MRNGLTWLVTILLGLTLGIGGAMWSLSNSTFGEDIRIGPWSTGRAIGTADADMRTRAIVALRGLLALPASEARYFTARNDSAGRPLYGRCSYAVRGGPLNARWWSVTLYDREGWLIPNPQQQHSLGSSGFGRSVNGNWSFVVGPQDEEQAGIPTGRPGPFELTLRAYRPSGVMAGNILSAQMPVIERLECAP